MNPNNHITYIKICCHENQVNSPNLKMWVEEQTNKKKKKKIMKTSPTHNSQKTTFPF